MDLTQDDTTTTDMPETLQIEVDTLAATPLSLDRWEAQQEAPSAPPAAAEPPPMVPCVRCAEQMFSLSGLVGHRGELCRNCAEIVCWNCNTDDPSAGVMRRSLPEVPNPVLCTRCCAQYPGREWMRASLPEIETANVIVPVPEEVA